MHAPRAPFSVAAIFDEAGVFISVRAMMVLAIAILSPSLSLSLAPVEWAGRRPPAAAEHAGARIDRSLGYPYRNGGYVRFF